MVALPAPREPLSDGVVVLRRFSSDDVPAVTAACQDPEIPRWTAGIPEPYEEHHAREWIARHDSFWNEQHIATFAFCDVTTGQLLGSMTLADVDVDHRTAVIGYWAAPWARNRGATTRALRLICRWGFDSLGVETVHLDTIVGNRASERVAEKGGFHKVGTLENHKPKRSVDPDARYDVTQWVLRADEASRGSRSSSERHFDNDCQNGGGGR